MGTQRAAAIFYRARTSAGLSQAELAERIGTSAALIDDIEEAGHVPSLELLNKLATAVGHEFEFGLSA